VEKLINSLAAYVDSPVSNDIRSMTAIDHLLSLDFTTFISKAPVSPATRAKANSAAATQDFLVSFLAVNSIAHGLNSASERTQSYAITALQKYLLEDDRKTFAGDEWNTILLNVIIPAVKKTAKPASTAAANTVVVKEKGGIPSSSPVPLVTTSPVKLATDVTKMRLPAVKLLAKVFLQALPAIVGGDYFVPLWTHLVEEVEVTVRMDSMLREAGNELFKNIVLVMAASGHWTAGEIDGTEASAVWTPTWKRVQAFSPGSDTTIGLHEEMMILLKAHFLANEKKGERKEGAS
jgi:hypothetical protein